MNWLLCSKSLLLPKEEHDLALHPDFNKPNSVTFIISQSSRIFRPRLQIIHAITINYTELNYKLLSSYHMVFDLKKLC